MVPGTGQGTHEDWRVEGPGETGASSSSANVAEGAGAGKIESSSLHSFCQTDPQGW